MEGGTGLAGITPSLTYLISMLGVAMVFGPGSVLLGSALIVLALNARAIFPAWMRWLTRSAASPESPDSHSSPSSCSCSGLSPPASGSWPQGGPASGPAWWCSRPSRTWTPGAGSRPAALRPAGVSLPAAPSWPTPQCPGSWPARGRTAHPSRSRGEDESNPRGVPAEPPRTAAFGVGSPPLDPGGPA